MKYMYLQCEHAITKEPVNRYHCRGPIKAHDDPAAYIAMMRRKGLEAFTSPELIGDALRRIAGGKFEALPARPRRNAPGTRPGPAQATFGDSPIASGAAD